MRKAVVGIGLGIWCLVAGLATPVAAQVAPPIVNQPAATLLLPYFEVDLDDAQGIDTIFSVNNASASAAVAHVTLWTDVGIPALAFDIYLTGYDVQTLSLRNVLQGKLPVTADAGSDPTNTLSFKGPLSQDINFPGSSGPCATQASALAMGQLSATYVSYMRSVFTGGPSPFDAQGRCLARNLGTPSVARGYVTVDSVTQCNLATPASPGYFAGIADSRNILWGDYAYVVPGQDVMQGDALVSIFTDWLGTDPELSVPGEYTFYGKYSAWSAIDRREPLATTFAARFVAPKDFKTAAKAQRRPYLPASTDLLVWRDQKYAVQPFACNALPPYVPLSHENIVIFDEQENPEAIAPGDVTPFPAAAQRVTVAGTAMPTTQTSGWLYLNLNTTVAPAGANPPEDPLAAQAWVSVAHRVQQGPNGGRYESLSRAIRLDSAREAAHVVLIP